MYCICWTFLLQVTRMIENNALEMIHIGPSIPMVNWNAGIIYIHLHDSMYVAYKVVHVLCGIQWPNHTIYEGKTFFLMM